MMRDDLLIREYGFQRLEIEWEREWERAYEEYLREEERLYEDAMDVLDELEFDECCEEE